MDVTVKKIIVDGITKYEVTDNKTKKKTIMEKNDPRLNDLAEQGLIDSNELENKTENNTNTDNKKNSKKKNKENVVNNDFNEVTTVIKNDNSNENNNIKTNNEDNFKFEDNTKEETKDESPKPMDNQELLTAKKKKLDEIKEAWEKADENPCSTGLTCLDGSELVIQYSSFDREIWSKKIVGIVMDLLKAGKFEIIPNSYEPLNNTMQITELESVQIGIGQIPARVYLMIKDIEVDIRDAHNKFRKINIGTMLQASIAQNMQVEKDLYKKWKLEEAIATADSIEKLNLISW